MKPSDWIVRWAPLIAPGARVLDLASGTGRHARYLAARGALVLAVDRDAAALDALATSAPVDVLCADLETGEWPLRDAGFDAIVVANYLHRPLFPSLRNALAPGGVLVYETFAAGQQAFGRPTNPDFLLRAGELLTHCTGLHVLAFEDGVIGQPPAARVQRIVALAAGAEGPGHGQLSLGRPVAANEAGAGGG